MTDPKGAPVDAHLKLLIASLEQMRYEVTELQNARPMDLRFIRFNRLLWVVKHCVDAASAASVDLTVELATLKGQGVNL